MKQTEIGLIPDDWEVKSLGEVATIVGGGTPSTLNSAYWNGDIQWFTPAELSDSKKYVSKSERTITERGLKESSAKLLPKGTVLLTTRASIGITAILENPASTNQGFQSLIAKNNCCSEFLYYVIPLIKDEMLSRASGSTFAEISAKKLSTINFQLPPLPEQQRIAKSLSDVDALISTTEKLIQKKKNIKQGAMQNLLTGKKRLPGFTKSTNYKQSELGLIPENWEVKSLGEIAETFTGLTYSPENVAEHGTLVLRSSNIKNEQLCFEDNVFVQMAIPERAFVKENDILICVRNGSKALIGKSAIITKAAVGMAFGAFMTVLRSTIVNQNYLLYVWQSDFVQKQVTDNLGATINQITNADFKKFNVIITPNKEEQTAIANVLSSMDKEIEILNTKLEKHRNLKTAMMQQLLTGKIRL